VIVLTPRQAALPKPKTRTNVLQLCVGDSLLLCPKFVQVTVGSRGLLEKLTVVVLLKAIPKS